MEIMAEYQEKFIVINKKHIAILNESNPEVIEKLSEAFTEFNMTLLNEHGIDVDNKYYVCNQDEPYADVVISVILTGEDNKCIVK
jgi:hypothetical protein